MCDMMTLEAHHRAHRCGDASLDLEDIEELCMMKCKRQCDGPCAYTDLCRCVEECNMTALTCLLVATVAAEWTFPSVPAVGKFSTVTWVA